eukprot:19507_1
MATKALKADTIIHFEEEKYEHLKEKQSHQRFELVQPKEGDYIDCHDNAHQSKDCNVLKRILHLLCRYQDHDDMYEYLSSLKDYDLPTFLEDWHQAKNNHLRNE